VVLIFGLLLIGLVGCGDNPRSKEIGEVISLISDTTETYKTLKNDLKAAVEKYNKTPDRKIPAEDWKKWTVKAEAFKDLAYKAQLYKNHLEAFRDATTDEQKKQFTKAQGEAFRTAVVELDQEERAFNAALEEAVLLTTDAERPAVDAFRRQVKDGKDMFEMLTKQRS
jgi:hypothetical protein